jgi:hypothetical protein
MARSGGLKAMAQTSYTITDSNIILTLTPADGYLVSLTMTTPPTAYEAPRWDEGSQRGSRMLRSDMHDLISVSPQTNGGTWQP